MRRKKFRIQRGKIKIEEEAKNMINWYDVGNANHAKKIDSPNVMEKRKFQLFTIFLTKNKCNRKFSAPRKHNRCNRPEINMAGKHSGHY